jgi:cytochrome P450
MMQAGFKSNAIQRYLLEMVPQVEQAVANWPVHSEKPLLAYPTFKNLTLDLAATIFLGMDLGDEASKINKAFETTVAASMPKIPLAIPGTLLWRGIRARKYLCDYFQNEDLEHMEQTEWVMKEALRMYPPLSTLPKYSLKPFEFEGLRIPANVLVATYPIHTHYMEEYWTQPLQFDPSRFSQSRAEHKKSSILLGAVQWWRTYVYRAALCHHAGQAGDV